MKSFGYCKLTFILKADWSGHTGRRGSARCCRHKLVTSELTGAVLRNIDKLHFLHVYIISCFEPNIDQILNCYVVIENTKNANVS